jgi:hypothetical protein
MRVQVLGTPFFQGALLVYFRPNNGFATGVPATSINDALMCPNVILYANQSTPACLEIPFTVPTNIASTNFSVEKPYYNFNTSFFSNDVGALYAKVIVPFGSVNTTTVKVSVHVTFADIKFFVPKNGSMIAPLSFSTTAKDLELRSRLDKIVTELKDMNLDVPPQWLPSQATFEMEELALAALPSMSDLLKDGIDRLKKKVFKSVGLDKPTNPLVSDAERMTTSTNYNHVEGVVPLDRMTMTTSFVDTAKANTFPSNQDEMDMSYILRKEQFVANFYIRSVLNVGSLLFTCPMSPLCVPPVTGPNSGLPLLTRFYLLTKYWRGTLKFHIKLSMTDMQTAKILVVKAYNIGKFTTPPSLSDVTNYDTETYEINKGGQEIIISVNYNSLTQFNFNAADYLSGTLQHGQLFIYLIQPTQFPVSALNYITASVYMSAGEDFAFYGPAEYPFFRPADLHVEPVSSLTTKTSLDYLDLAVSPLQHSKLNAVFETLETEVNNLSNVEDPLSRERSSTTFNVSRGNRDVEESVIPSTVPSFSSNTVAPSFVHNPLVSNMKPIKHLREMVRRYVQCGAFTAQDVYTFRVADVFRSMQFSSILTNISSMYHGFKGGLRFRMLLPELSQGLKVKVYYRYPLPDLSYNSSVAHSARTAVVPVQMKNHAKFTYTYENPTVGGNGPAFVPLLVSVNQVDCHLDFEITCENPFNWNVIKQFNSLVPEEDIAADLGSLIFVFPTPYENKQVSLFVSVADESRLAMMYYNSDIIISTPAPSSDFAAIVPPAVRPYFFASN